MVHTNMNKVISITINFDVVLAFHFVLFAIISSLSFVILFYSNILIFNHFSKLADSY